MHIDSLLNIVKKQVSANINDIRLSVSSDWEQGRTLYGGISASLVYQAMRESVNSQKVIRSLSTSFIGPIEADKEFSISIEVLREGKNVVQVIGRLVQNNQVALISQASFGMARQSKIHVSSPLQHAMAYPQKPKGMPNIPKVTPKFIRHFDLAQTKGGWPFTGKKESDLHGWMRFKEQPSDFSDAHLIALIDIWPPTVLQLLRWPTAASTMSWSLEFIHPNQKPTANDWLAYQAKTNQAADGYAHTEANIWNKHGSLIAISRQVVTVFS